MKAWFVQAEDKFCSAVVFAETRGKAKSLALSTDACEGADYCDISACRLPQVDKYYKEGKTELDWFDPEDRIIMVRDCSFYCEYVEPSVCEECSAKEFCDEYAERKSANKES